MLLRVVECKNGAPYRRSILCLYTVMWSSKAVATADSISSLV